MVPIPSLIITSSLRREAALVDLGNLVAGVNLGLQIHLGVLLVEVVLLDELGALNLVLDEHRQVLFCEMVSKMHYATYASGESRLGIQLVQTDLSARRSSPGG